MLVNMRRRGGGRIRHIIKSYSVAQNARPTREKVLKVSRIAEHECIYLCI